MRGPAKLASYIAIGMILGGFALIALAWNGAASVGYLQGQFPYLLSGGVAGLGLIGAGSGLLFVQVQRELDAEEARHYQRVVDSLHQTVSALRGGVPTPSAVALAPATRRSESGTVAVVTPPAPTGNDLTIAGPEAWAAPASAAEEALVVVGRSSFHDPSCHLVNTRTDLELMRRDEAIDAGLRPCRVCKP